MVVRDWSRGGDIPSRFYKLPLPIMQGLNHITWCSNMNLKVGCTSTLEGLIESDQHYMHVRLNSNCGPSIFFPSLTPPASQRYWRHWSGVYHLDSDWLFTRISHKYLFLYEHRPHFKPIFDNWHGICGVELISSCMDLLSSPHHPSSLWAQAWTATGTDGVESLREDGILPPFLQPTYIHLRYKPVSRKGVLYQYKTSLDDNPDISVYFPMGRMAMQRSIPRQCQWLLSCASCDGLTISIAGLITIQYALSSLPKSWWIVKMGWNGIMGCENVQKCECEYVKSDVINVFLNIR